MTSSEPNRLPQLAVLPEIVRNLYDLPPVKAVFLGGSFGRGEGDLWSDLDLQVLVDEEFADFLDDAEIRLVTGRPPVALERFKLGPTGWMHHMILADGIIVDLFCRTELSVAETRMWIALSANMASLPEAIATHPKPWSPVSIAQGEVSALVTRYWVTMHKHRRGMGRTQDLVIWTGIHHSVAQLVRLEFIGLTGQDCGDLTRMAIYDLSGVNEWWRVLGMSPNVNPVPPSSSVTDWEGQVTLLLARGQAATRLLGQQWKLEPDPTPLMAVVSKGLADGMALS